MSSFVRQALSATRAASRTRFFSTSSPARKDFVQDLYVKELKGYKPIPQPKDAHVGAVKEYAIPAVPQAPALPTDLASELAAYDAAEPVSDTVVISSSTEEEGATGAEAFLSFLEQDIPKAEAHH